MYFSQKYMRKHSIDAFSSTNPKRVETVGRSFLLSKTSCMDVQAKSMESLRTRNSLDIFTAHFANFQKNWTKNPVIRMNI